MMLFVRHPKICISIVFSFSWELKWPQEKLKTMRIEILGLQTKSIVVCYGTFCCGQLLHGYLVAISKSHFQELSNLRETGPFIPLKQS